MDNCIILVLSQALLYLKDTRVEQANKQLLKRKLASELVSDILLCTIGNHKVSTLFMTYQVYTSSYIQRTAAKHDE